MARKKRISSATQDPNGKDLIGYVRVSDTTGREDTMVSPEIQINAMNGWAAANGARIKEFVSDLNKTGRESTKRQIHNIIDRVAAGEAHGVVVYMVDRWGRDHLDAGINILDLQLAKGLFFSATENLNEIATPTGKFTLTVLLAMAELASNQIGQRWAGLHQLRLHTHQRPPAGGARFGYTYERSQGRGHWGKYEVDPVTGPVLRELYLKYIGGASLSQLVDWLRARDVTTTRGTQFSKSALYVALDSGFGAGLLVINDTEKSWGVDRTFLPGSQESVISEGEWEQYKAKRLDNSAPRTKNAPYRLSGMVFCSGCHKRAYRCHNVQKRKDGNFTMAFLSCHLKAKMRARAVCPAPARMAMHKIDEAVYAWLLEWASDQKRAERELAARMKTQVIKGDVKKIERKLKAAEDKLVQVAEDTASHLIIESAGKLMQERANKQIEDLKAHLADLRREEKINTSPPLVQIDALLAAWEVLEPAQVNARLKGFIQAIYIHQAGAEQRVEIYGTWQHDPHALARETWGAPVGEVAVSALELAGPSS